MFRTFLTLAAVVIALPTSPVFAQTTSPRLGPSVSVSHRIAPHEAWHNHSSTAYEGAKRGQAAWMAAYGDLLLNESQAAYVWQHVESLHYDNELKKTSTALTRKRMLDAYREYERELRRGRAEQAKELWKEKYAELARTYRLDDFQLNWATGDIYWPALAASPRYAKHRQEIGTLIAQIFHYGSAVDSRYHDQVSQACEKFRAQLRTDAAEDHPSTRNEYLAMQRFLVGLKYTPYLLDNSSMPKQLAMK